MTILLYALALISGYLLGSISFTRILGRWFAPGEDLSITEVRMSESGDPFQMRSVSATSLAFRKGPKAGCLVSALDMLKAAIPVLAFRVLFPGTDYYWLAAAGSVMGHNFPVYYKFKGGRGMSPLYGGLLVIDWLSIPITTVAGMLLGIFVFRDMFAAWTFGVPLLIPWMILRHKSPESILYSVLVTVFFFAAIYPELKDHLDKRRTGETEKVDIKEFFSGAGNMFVRRGGKGGDADESEEGKSIDHA
jgi:glycerol-3-phosphate acyltransferase PlsY